MTKCIYNCVDNAYLRETSTPTESHHQELPSQNISISLSPSSTGIEHQLHEDDIESGPASSSSPVNKKKLQKNQ